MVIYSHLYLLFLLIMTSRYALQRVSATCYTPGGQERTSPPSRGIYEYQPCSKSDKFSMCCALNRTSGELPGPDRCRDDGLCENPIGFAQLWRQSCTDPSWLSPSCIKICLHGMTDEGVKYEDTDVRVTQCPDKSICCGWDNTTCCNKREGVWIKDGSATTVDPSAAIHPTSNLLSPSSLTSIPSPLSLASNYSSQSKPNLSRGATVGAGIGGACGIIIIIIIIYGLIRYFRSQRPFLSQQQENFTPLQEQRGITEVANFELSGAARRNELGGLSRVELDT